MKDPAIAEAFAAEGSWVSRFVIDGEVYGGFFDPLNDPRLPIFFAEFPEVETILELGSLEGGHTIALSRAPKIKRVLGIEGRPVNLARAQVAARLLKAEKIQFVQANLERADLREFGNFDAIFCVGLLYHLPEPWILVRQFPGVSSRVFLWTHYCLDCEAEIERENYRGRMQPEHGLQEPLSGLSPESFWPTLDSLQRIFREAGFSNLRILGLEPDGAEGPGVLLTAELDSH